MLLGLLTRCAIRSRKAFYPGSFLPGSRSWVFASARSFLPWHSAEACSSTFRTSSAMKTIRKENQWLHRPENLQELSEPTRLRSRVFTTNQLRHQARDGTSLPRPQMALSKGSSTPVSGLLACSGTPRGQRSRVIRRHCLLLSPTKLRIDAKRALRQNDCNKVVNGHRWYLQGAWQQTTPTAPRRLLPIALTSAQRGFLLVQYKDRLSG